MSQLYGRGGRLFIDDLNGIEIGTFHNLELDFEKQDKKLFPETKQVKALGDGVFEVKMSWPAEEFARTQAQLLERQARPPRYTGWDPPDLSRMSVPRYEEAGSRLGTQYVTSSVSSLIDNSMEASSLPNTRVFYKTERARSVERAKSAQVAAAKIAMRRLEITDRLPLLVKKLMSGDKAGNRSTILWAGKGSMWFEKKHSGHDRMARVSASGPVVVSYIDPAMSYGRQIGRGFQGMIDYRGTGSFELSKDGLFKYHELAKELIDELKRQKIPVVICPGEIPTDEAVLTQLVMTHILKGTVQ